MHPSQTQAPTRFLAKAQLFLDWRIVNVFCLGMLSGLPWTMFGSSLSLWLKEEGVSRTEIGFAGLIYVVFSINFLWAPLIDRFRPKWSPRAGHRKIWVACAQGIIIAACLIIALSDTQFGIKALVLLALIIATASATQDIAIDAYRVDQFKAHESAYISAAAAASTAGWYTGFAGLGYLPLWLSDHGWSWPHLYFLFAGITFGLICLALLLPNKPQSSSPNHSQNDNDNDSINTSTVTKLDEEAQIQKQNLADQESTLNEIKHYALTQKYWVALVCSLPILTTIWAIAGAPGLSRGAYDHPLFVLAMVALEFALFAFIIHQLQRLHKQTRDNFSQPSSSSAKPKKTLGLDYFLAFLLNNLLLPLREFFSRNGLKFALTLLFFVFFFKIGEAFLGRMSIIFYKEVGFSNTDIANNSKLLNWLIIVACAMPCAWFNAKFGIIKGLLISGICMALSNLMFAWVAMAGPDLRLYMATIIVDGVTSTWATIAFVAFISMLCNHRFSATQYALLASLGSLSRMTLASFSGQIVDALNGNWAIFFVMTTLMVIPGLLLLWMLSAKLKQRYLNTPRSQPS